MKRIFFLLCLLSSSLFATVRPFPCGFGLQGEYLYFNSRSEQSDFALLLKEGDQSLTIVNNQGEFKSGFRVEGVYGIDPLHDLRARFTYFHPGKHLRTVSGRISNPFLRDDASFDGFASSKLGIRYYAIEALYSRWLYDCRNFDLALQAGFNYSNIHYDEKVILSPLIPSSASRSSVFLNDSKFWGLGPELALDFEYPFLDCGWGIWSVAANARGMILASVTKTRLTTRLSPPPAEQRFSGESIWRATPSFDARIGLNWEYPATCFGVQLEVGYEWIWIHLAANKYSPVDLPVNQYSDVNFQGPYVALGVNF